MRRKDFLQWTGLAGIGGLLVGCGDPSPWNTPEAQAAAALARSAKSTIDTSRLNGSVFDLAADPIEKVRFAIVGLGNRGGTLIEMLSSLVADGHAEITAISDINGAKVDKALERIAAFQANAPATFTGTEDAWQGACKPEVADLLLVVTPWELHTPMALFAMESGLHVATEVPIAYTEADCQALVETAERTQKHCVMLENCCYNEEELWLLQMVQEGAFGTLTHAECAYLHDLRGLMMHPTYYEDRWRLKHHLERNGNFYTTHGLGPVCQYFDILRGDRLTHLTSMSSGEVALSEALKASDDPQLRALGENGVSCGDVNTTLIATDQGRSIMLQFDTHTGRPYNRLNKLVGSKATHYGYPSRIYLDKGPDHWGHAWEDQANHAELKDRYEHPLWARLQARALENKQGHGGMDFVMMYRLVRCLNRGVSLDHNVYDGVLWSLVGALSERSVAAGATRVDIPDISSGKWHKSQPHPIHREI